VRELQAGKINTMDGLLMTQKYLQQNATVDKKKLKISSLVEEQ